MNELSDLTQRIAEIFDRLNIEVPSSDTDLFESGLLDSLAFVELLVEIEEQMGVMVSLEQLEPEHFRSLERIASFVLANRRFSKVAGDIRYDA